MATRRRGAEGEVGDVPEEVRAKALTVHARLCAEYGCPIAFFHELDPLSELVSSLLSHRTKNADSGRAFRQLRARFPDWIAVRDAATAEVEAAIAPATWPEQKAPRIQAILREIGARRARLDDGALDFLGELPVPEARAWLESIPGVGPKTSAAVLLFSRLRRPALPVDSHHHRVAVRLGLIPASVDVGPAHARLAAQLPPDWDAQTVYDNHEALMFHGQRCCYFRNPDCGRCVVLDLCPTGQARLGTARPAAAQAERIVPIATASERPASDQPRPERPLPAVASPTPATRGSRPPTRHARPRPQEQLLMIEDSDRERLRRVHADPEQIDQEAAEQRARRAGRGADDVNDPEHYKLSAADRAHGTHGRGTSDERLVDEQATDTGDDAQLRRAGGGGDQPPEPNAFREGSPGLAGGPGWGSEQVGGSTVDRRPDDASA